MKYTLEFTHDGKTYTYKSLMLAEARMLRQITGGQIIGPADFETGVLSYDPEAITALVWLAHKRVGEDIDTDALDFDIDELNLRLLDEDGREVTPKLDGNGDPVFRNGKPVMLFDGEEEKPRPTAPVAESTG